MPIYDFQCSNCGFKNELLRKISEPGTITCPKCNQETFAKMLSAPAFQLSGSGWYATDFKDKKDKGSQTNNQTKTDKSEEKSTDAEAKPAACNPGCACH